MLAIREKVAWTMIHKYDIDEDTIYMRVTKVDHKLIRLAWYKLISP
jgi:hypothetical protein